MPTFLFSYRLPTDYTPGRPEIATAWVEWFDGMGESLLDRGNPVFESIEVGTCREGTRLGGYSFVSADDLESAAATAKGSPIVEAGGGVEVGMVTVINPESASTGGLSGREDD
jgi:hypothetical protein